MLLVECEGKSVNHIDLCKKSSMGTLVVCVCYCYEQKYMYVQIKAYLENHEAFLPQKLFYLKLSWHRVIYVANYCNFSSLPTYIYVISYCFFN